LSKKHSIKSTVSIIKGIKVLPFFNMYSRLIVGLTPTTSKDTTGINTFSKKRSYDNTISVIKGIKSLLFFHTF